MKNVLYVTYFMPDCLNSRQGFESLASFIKFSKQSNLNDVNVSFGVYRWRFERNCDKVEATERRFTKLGSHEVLANIDLP